MSELSRGSSASARGAPMTSSSNLPGSTEMTSAPASSPPVAAASPKPCHANRVFAPESLR